MAFELIFLISLYLIQLSINIFMQYTRNQCLIYYTLILVTVLEGLFDL